MSANVGAANLPRCVQCGRRAGNLCDGHAYCRRCQGHRPVADYTDIQQGTSYTEILLIPDGVQPAIADVVYWSGLYLWMVSRINVPAAYRGQGYGRQLLRLLTDRADSRGVYLYLAPVANPLPTGLDQRALVAWYERAGFVKLSSGLVGHMMRPCRPPTT